MDVFTLRNNIIDDYSRYISSFIKIYDSRISEKVEKEIKEGLLWPQPLIQINPPFAISDDIESLVDQKLLHPECRKIFRYGKDKNNEGKALRLYQHQVDAIKAALSGDNYVLTTGTGSGKSLAYIIPIVNDVLSHGSGRGIQAIIVYPMNALANSQEKELTKFLCEGYPDNQPPVSFKRYTGQESEEEKTQIIQTPPDILLTNYVMLELILTRPAEKKLIRSAQGLKFLVLDELHTYRGRQGADVAMLVRRLRQTVSPNGHTPFQCVGTSATLAGPGTLEQQCREVAGIASKLFGSHVKPERIIYETLTPITRVDEIAKDDFKVRLKKSVIDWNNDTHTYESFIQNPLCIWIENTLGIEKDLTGRLKRYQPIPIQGENGAAKKLADVTGLEEEFCIQKIQDALLKGFAIKNPHTDTPVFAFKVHQFLSKGDTVYASPEPEDIRYITLNGQQFVPGSGKTKILLPLQFCRECGQEYFSVWKIENPQDNTFFFTARHPSQPQEEGTPGYLYIRQDFPWPDTEIDMIQRLPEDWIEDEGFRGHVAHSKRRYLPQKIWIYPDGRLCEEDNTPGTVAGHFIPSPFVLCLRCGVAYNPRIRSDFPKLATLATEGRSTATTILSLSTIQNLRKVDSLKPEAQKLLSFTDNRQDASLQAGHFNDFIEISLLRSALYHALENAGAEGISHDKLPQSVYDALNLSLTEFAALVPDEHAIARINNIKRAFKEVLGYRLYHDLRRGWRIVAPNLEQCGLLEIEYPDLVQICAADDLWKGHTVLAKATPEKRMQICKIVLDYMRRGLAIKVDYLRPDYQERIRQQSSQLLKWPWAIGEEEIMAYSSCCFPRAKIRDTELPDNLFVSPKGALGIYLRRAFPEFKNQIHTDQGKIIIFELFKALEKGGLIEACADPHREDPLHVPGYQIPAVSMIWKAGDGRRAFHDPLRTPNIPEKGGRTNPFFVNLYKHTATSMKGLFAREHTAQVAYDQRETRETDFRKGNLPIMYCSPTMELGVDIAELNCVNMRNVPPTPANYAQRSGRAGRSGQPALITTYCAQGNSHDQHFFSRPEQMVAGMVSTPKIDLANEDLIRSHVHAIWLAETGLDLGKSLKDILDVSGHHPSLNLLDRVKDAVHAEAPKQKAAVKIAALMKDLSDELSVSDWYSENWIKEVLAHVGQNFERACDRWRNLFQAAVSQRDRQTDVINDVSRSPQDRENARRLRAEAESQIELLLQASASLQSDFYSYRYFAGEGFLPGYNFPRLPLSAFIPGRSRRGVHDKDEFVSRARFLAISEFGPGNFIYHEGARFIIHRVIMALDKDQDMASGRIKQCRHCGYIYPILNGDGIDLCEICKTPFETDSILDKLFRLRNVSTRRKDQITCDEEERTRYGYYIQTGFRFAERGGQASHRIAEVKSVDGQVVATLKYGHGATIWRMNLGWKNRPKNAAKGFLLNTERGLWVKESADNQAEDNLSNFAPGRIQRVVPYVEDRKNCLIIEPSKPLDSEVMASLQSVFKEAIQRLYQLEEYELAAEPLPSSDDRQVILLYEAAEGGAGVLRRLIDDATAIHQIARCALDLCHFNPDDGSDLGKAPHSKEECVAACYHCLMNYSNQRDHMLLDRHRIKDLLLELSHARVETAPTQIPRAEHLKRLKNNTDSQLERDWLDFMDVRNLRLPSRAQVWMEPCHTRPDFVYDACHAVVYIDGPSHQYPDRKQRDAAQTACMEDCGYTVIRFTDSQQWDMMIRNYPHVFGSME